MRDSGKFKVKQIKDKNKQIDEMTSEFNKRTYESTQKMYEDINNIQNDESLNREQKNNKIGQLKAQIKREQEAVKKEIKKQFNYEHEDRFRGNYQQYDKDGNLLPFSKISDEYIDKIVKLNNDFDNELKKFNEDIKHKFHNKDLEYACFTNKENKQYESAIVDLDNIAKKENLILSKSPYSESYYLLKADEEIGWGSKPLDSYRLSDHWNFISQDAIHCELSGTTEYVKSVIIGKYNGSKYEEVKRYGK